MARVRMVTRTIESTKVTAMCINPATATVSHNEYVISQAYTDPALILKHVKKVYETENNVIVAIEQSEVQETLYGMTEQKFMELAEILPPRQTAEEPAEEPTEKKKRK